MGRISKREFQGRILFSALDFFKNDLEISEAQIATILNLPLVTIQDWFSKRMITMNEDTVIAVAHLLGVHENLYVMFSVRKNRLAWLKTPHAEMYGKMSPLEAMCRPGGLSAVLSYTVLMRDRGA